MNYVLQVSSLIIPDWQVVWSWMSDDRVSADLLTQLIRPVSWAWDSGGTAIIALSVTLITLDTAFIRFSALIVKISVVSLSSFGSVWRLMFISLMSNHKFIHKLVMVS